MRITSVLALCAAICSSPADAVEAEAGRFALHANHTQYSDEDFNKEVESNNWQMFLQHAHQNAKEGVMQAREKSVEAAVEMDANMDVYISNDWDIQEDVDMQHEKQLSKISLLTRAAESNVLQHDISEAERNAQKVTDSIPDARVTLSKALPKQDRALRARAPAWN
mmetsp:Transcript_76021/g.180904  ORF Transcript_76021/g.180904 Transcript_76021/m.180904 type:complete len:166 (-) Transcript_76021:149-646(-)|eukprot:CAMPEP_0178380862 /NCGR_PEP_ID=MMETSP0689_2-20121128/5684_1 /TAXON_ID=160604 /ORGANISM="Amphidinium massartii, Strain CS-259" /LENGTH=165 /DNA_ID=CAMNT_0020001023 /DNA_START=108 /DNA_END=605 /DNA_ORIENTATION=-